MFTIKQVEKIINKIIYQNDNLLSGNNYITVTNKLLGKSNIKNLGAIIQLAYDLENVLNMKESISDAIDEEKLFLFYNMYRHLVKVYIIEKPSEKI